jgi:hypothetical protein
MENETQVIETVIVEPAAIIENEVHDAVDEVVAEVTEAVETKSELENLRAEFGEFKTQIFGRLDEILASTHVAESVALDTANAVENLETAIETEIEIETAIEQAETIAQIENDIEVESELVEETLDTNDVIDAILPETKRVKNRIRYI